MTVPFRECQKAAAQWAVDLVFFCLNFACGVGKTRAGVAIAKAKGIDTMIIAPKNLCEQWYDELVLQGVDPADIFIASTPEATAGPVGYNIKFDTWLKRGS